MEVRFKNTQDDTDIDYIIIIVSQKFTYTKLTVFLNNLEDSKNCCNNLWI